MPSSPAPRIRRGWIAAGLLLGGAFAVALSLSNERPAPSRVAPPDDGDVSAAQRDAERCRLVQELDRVEAQLAAWQAEHEAELELEARRMPSCALAADGTPIPCR